MKNLKGTLIKVVLIATALIHLSPKLLAYGKTFEVINTAPVASLSSNGRAPGGSTGKKINVSVATDYTGQKLGDLQGLFNNKKSELFSSGIDLSYSINNATTLTGETTDINYDVINPNTGRSVIADPNNAYAYMNTAGENVRLHRPPITITGVGIVVMTAGEGTTGMPRYALTKSGQVWENVLGAWERVEGLKNIIQIAFDGDNTLMALDINHKIWLYGKDKWRLSESNYRLNKFFATGININQNYSVPGYIPEFSQFDMSSIKQIVPLQGETNVHSYALLKNDGTVVIQTGKGKAFASEVILTSGILSYDNTDDEGNITDTVEYTAYWYKGRGTQNYYSPSISGVSYISSDLTKYYFTLNDGRVISYLPRYVVPGDGSYARVTETHWNPAYISAYHDIQSDMGYSGVKKYIRQYASSTTRMNPYNYYAADSEYMIKQDGSVWVNGSLNNYGQMGLGHKNKITSWTRLPLTNIVDIMTTYSYNLYLDSTGNLYRTGTIISDGGYSLWEGGMVREQLQYLTPRLISSNVKKMAISPARYVIQLTDGSLRKGGCFTTGYNEDDEPVYSDLFYTPGIFGEIKNLFIDSSAIIVSLYDNTHYYSGDLSRMMPDAGIPFAYEFTNISMLNGYEIVYGSYGRDSLYSNHNNSYTPYMSSYNITSKYSLRQSHIFIKKPNDNKVYGLGYCENNLMLSASDMTFKSAIDITSTISKQYSGKPLWIGLSYVWLQVYTTPGALVLNESTGVALSVAEGGVYNVGPGIGFSSGMQRWVGGQSYFQSYNYIPYMYTILNHAQSITQSNPSYNVEVFYNRGQAYVADVRLSCTYANVMDLGSSKSDLLTGTADEKYWLYISDAIGDNMTNPYGQYFALPTLTWEFKDYLSKNGVKSIIITDPSNYDKFGNLLTVDGRTQQLSLRTLSSLTSGRLLGVQEFSTFFDSLKPFLVDTPLPLYFVIGDSITFVKSYSDYERDTGNINIAFKERWEVAQDKDFFENSMGYMNNVVPMNDYNNGIHNWGSFSESFINSMTADKVGRYIISYGVQDNPSRNNKINGVIPNEAAFYEYNRSSIDRAENRTQIYVNRRPIANFTYTLVGVNFTMTNTSFDWDHLSLPNKGIADTFIRYKKTTDTAWTNGQPPSILEAGAVYVVSMQVKDIDGFTSDWVTKTLETNPNAAPIAAFTIDRSMMDYNNPSTNKINDFSTDPDNDPLAYHWWVTFKENVVVDGVQKYAGNIYKDYGVSKPDINELVSLSKRNGKNIRFNIHLQVNDLPHIRVPGLLPKYSNIAVQELNIGTNNAPTALFDLEKTVMLPGSFNKITDRSYDIDNDLIVQYRYTVINKATNTIVTGYENLANAPDVSKLPIGNYKIQLIVKDSPRWGEPKESIPFTRDLAIVNATLAIDATPTSINWTNQPINVTINVSNGYNYKSASWKWSKQSISPTIWDGSSTSRSFNATLSNTKANEGLWYLHMLAKDELGQATNMRFFYALDVTAPIIGFTYDKMIGKGILSVTDELSGLNETKYKWSQSSSWVDDSTGFTLWNGENPISKLGGSPYLHVYARDVAGNINRTVLGPYQDPLELKNFRITHMVNPPVTYSLPIYTKDMPVIVKAGYKNSFEIDVTGLADTITVAAKDNLGNDLGTLNMIKKYDVDDYNSVWGFDFTTKLDTANGTIINFYIVGRNSFTTYDYNFNEAWSGDTLKINGNALEDAKINRKY